MEENNSEIKNENINTTKNTLIFEKTNPIFVKEKECLTQTPEIELKKDESEKKEIKKEIENDLEDKEKNQINIITKNSSLSPDLFSLSYISEYKCILCGLIPSPENSKEIICCGILLCEECLL